MVKYVLLDDEVESDASGGDSPGKRLRAAREKLDLDIKTVAKKLHMHEDSIIALENDNYDRFPAPIYVSGFLRNYARLLNLDPEPIVESYESLGKEAPPILSDLTSKIPRRRHRGIEPWAGYLAAGGILLMLLVWMLPSRNQSVDIELQSMSESQQPEPPVSISSMDNEQSTNDQADVTDMPEGNEDGAATDTDEATTAISEPALPIPSDTLVLHFSQDSWVEISDSTGRRLFYNMGKAGETTSLLGIAPFSVLLGYSPGVSIEYNGKPFDQSPYVRQDVARFRLGNRN